MSLIPFINLLMIDEEKKKKLICIQFFNKPLF